MIHAKTAFADAHTGVQQLALKVFTLVEALNSAGSGENDFLLVVMQPPRRLKARAVDFDGEGKLRPPQSQLVTLHVLCPAGAECRWVLNEHDVSASS